MHRLVHRRTRRLCIGLSISTATWTPQFVCAQVPVSLKPASASLAHEFTRIVGVRELRDGRVLVSDEKENSIVVADLRSGLVTPVGRTGRGPGEYTQAAPLWIAGGDSTVMYDMSSRRYLLLDGARVVQTLTPADAAIKSIGLDLPFGVEAGGRFVLGTVPRDASGRPRMTDSLYVLRFDRATGRKDSVSRLRSVMMTSEAAGGAPATAGGGAATKKVYQIGMLAPDQVAAFPDGWLAIARVAPYRVDWCAPGARCVSGPPIDATSQPMTERDKQAYLDARRRIDAWPPTNKLEETAGWPSTVPAFVVQTGITEGSPLLPLSDGRVLIARVPSSSVPSGRYDVVSRKGVRDAHITLKENERFVGVGTQSLFTAVQNANGVERLRRHPWP